MVIRSLNDVSRTPGPRAVALGFFDGVHLGHQRIINELVAESRRSGLVSTCLTFDPHPLLVLQPRSHGLKMLTSLEERLALFDSLGVETAIVAGFDQEFAMMSPGEFARSVLKEAIGARVVACGFNFTFGQGGEGTSADLARLGSDLGFAVRVHRPVLVDGVAVSSTVIRRAVEAGDVTRARVMLGRPYSLQGEVIAGDGRGKRLQIPTANLRVSPERLLPACGVYATVSETVMGRFPSVTNVGVRPTFPAAAATVETHIGGFSGDIYGTEMKVLFLKRLRDERLFAGGDELTEQVRKDAALAREIAAGEDLGGEPG